MNFSCSQGSTGYIRLPDNPKLLENFKNNSLKTIKTKSNSFIFITYRLPANMGADSFWIERDTLDKGTFFGKVIKNLYIQSHKKNNVDEILQ